MPPNDAAVPTSEVLTSSDLDDVVAPAPPAPPSRQRSAWRSRLSRFDMKVTPYLLISPFFILFIAFGIFPLAYNFVVSLRTWKLDDPSADGWAGLANYQRVFADGDFVKALINTFGIFLLSSGPQLLVALILAGLLSHRLRGSTGFRMGILLPYVTPIAASTLVFGFVFAKDSGLVNYVLSLVHVGPVDWHADRWSSWIAVSTMVNWRWIGYNTLIYLAAMQTVPRDLYEAAALDGAGYWRQFWRITVPLIRPAILFTIILSTIGGLQLFTEPLLFDENPASATGGSDGQFQTVAMLIYKVAWKDLNLGYASAMAWILFLVIVLLASFNGFLSSRVGKRP